MRWDSDETQNLIAAIEKLTTEVAMFRDVMDGIRENVEWAVNNGCFRCELEERSLRGSILVSVSQSARPDECSDLGETDEMKALWAAFEALHSDHHELVDVVASIRTTLKVMTSERQPTLFPMDECDPDL